MFIVCRHLKQGEKEILLRYAEIEDLVDGTVDGVSRGQYDAHHTKGICAHSDLSLGQAVRREDPSPSTGNSSDNHPPKSASKTKASCKG